ncbi:ABC transporter ATP-binding protein [Paracoccus sp. (in: a-proteobacteria)]|uniref:ABC transporter ATP-binding protein n=1 Tax=Paracoccus sp. TaxID=267 RepID=UPI00396D0414
MNDVIRISGLSAGYQPDLSILKDVDLTVGNGEFVVLLGPNGAGKSTLVKTVAGLVPVHGGSIRLRGLDISAVPAHLRLRHGLAFVPQTENLFTQMTIRENLQLAAQILPKRQRSDRISAMMETFPDLAGRANTRAGSLSGGQRQMLAVARALIVDPQVLILDEPSAGLSPLMVSNVFDRLREINGMGITIVLVEQNVRAGLQVASRGVILVEGRVAHDAPSATLADDPVVAELYLGSHRKEALA